MAKTIKYKHDSRFWIFTDSGTNDVYDNRGKISLDCARALGFKTINQFYMAILDSRQLQKEPPLEEVRNLFSINHYNDREEEDQDIEVSEDLFNGIIKREKINPKYLSKNEIVKRLKNVSDIQLKTKRVSLKLTIKEYDKIKNLQLHQYFKTYLKEEINKDSLIIKGKIDLINIEIVNSRIYSKINKIFL